MRENLDTILGLGLGYEGGFSNHPADNGGPTQYGITIGTFRAYFKKPKATISDLRKLTIAQAKEIYVKSYWNTVRGDDLPSGVDLSVYDCGINSGPGKAIRLLQQVLKVRVDGVIGDKTLAAVQTHRNIPQLIKDYNDARLAFMRSLKDWANFKNGWSIRVIGKDPRRGNKQVGKGIVGYSLELYAKSHNSVVNKSITIHDAENAPDVPKADPERVSVTRTPEGKAALTVGGASVGTALSAAATQVLPFVTVSNVVLFIFIALVIGGVIWFIVEQRSKQNSDVQKMPSDAFDGSYTSDDAAEAEAVVI